MSTVSVMYETPSRRMAFRVTAPAQVTIDGRTCRTKDWSTGGFATDQFDGAAAPGDSLPVIFVLDFQGFAISFCGQARVLRMEGRLLAAEFVNLGERELGLLRHFTSALINGQLVCVDAVLKNLDRPVTRILTNPPAPPSRGGWRAIRRAAIAVIYLAIGLAILAAAVLITVGSVTQVNVETAVTSVPLEQVVSADVGTLAEIDVTPGMQVSAGQLLFRVDSETALRNVEQARQELQAAHIALQEAAAKRADEDKKLVEYRAISTDQLTAKKAQTVSAIAARDVAKKELERYEALLDAKVISRQLYDSVKAKYEEQAANVEHAQAEEMVAATSVRSANVNGHFFSGNYLVGERNASIAQEDAAREQVKLAEAALNVSLQQESKRRYVAPFPAVVAKVFKSRGMTVDRGEALMVLRPTGVEPYIDAFLTQEQAGQVASGARATAEIPATGKRYPVGLVSVDRTAGFLRDMQTPKLQAPAFQWRSIEDRSAYAKLTFVGLSPAEREAISPGLPVFVSIPRKRTLLPQWLITAQAAASASPRLWPAESPLFTGARVADPRFEAVRLRVIEGADAALRSEPAPVETIQSAAVTDQSSPQFRASRRAFQDADNVAIMALAYRLTGKKKYQEGARRTLVAWARINRPTGMPIDETRLDAFLWGLDLLGPEAFDGEVTAWLNRWEAANRNYKFGSITSTNNHMTHHLKILVMLDRLLGRDADYARDVATVERHLKANLPAPDGKSVDYDQRDAMHYHVFDLEAWLEIALVTGCCRDKMDQAFQFFERTLASNPTHVEFARSTAAIDRKRAAAGFEYAKGHTFEVTKATRAIFGYATLPERRVDAGLWTAAEDGGKHDNLFYEARYYLWNGRR